MDAAAPQPVQPDRGPTPESVFPSVWVLAFGVKPDVLERLGDARALADRLGGRVGALVTGAQVDDPRVLCHHGADVVVVGSSARGVQTAVASAVSLFQDMPGPRIVLAPGDAYGREWAARLAVRMNWRLISPALMSRIAGEHLEVTALEASGRYQRTVRCEADQTVVMTLRPHVAAALPPDPARDGRIEHREVTPAEELLTVERHIPADPATADIRDSRRLIAGGRGLGDKTGFDLLRRFAERIKASVAASRVAVDLGWIERERQVGQTGKTVKPDLYIACGISGATHHLEGMSESKHVIAINTDPQAPIFKLAHFGLVADLHAVLAEAERELA